MDIKNLTLIPRTLQGVQFTGGNFAEVKQWVQDRLSFQQVTANADRLYLPAVGGVDILEPGDWVLYDPTDNAFRGAEDGAIQAFYQEVTPAEEQE